MARFSPEYKQREGGGAEGKAGESNEDSTIKPSLDATPDLRRAFCQPAGYPHQIA